MFDYFSPLIKFITPIEKIKFENRITKTRTRNIKFSSKYELDDIDDILANISRMRSTLGASQNSLESKAEYLNVAKENAMSSRSRIKDVDVAKESSEMVKSQILQQTSAAMLSQANQTPQLALNLLP